MNKVGRPVSPAVKDPSASELEKLQLELEGMKGQIYSLRVELQKHQKETKRERWQAEKRRNSLAFFTGLFISVIVMFQILPALTLTTWLVVLLSTGLIQGILSFKKENYLLDGMLIGVASSSLLFLAVAVILNLL